MPMPSHKCFKAYAIEFNWTNNTSINITAFIWQSHLQYSIKLIFISIFTHSFCVSLSLCASLSIACLLSCVTLAHIRHINNRWWQKSAHFFHWMLLLLLLVVCWCWCPNKWLLLLIRGCKRPTDDVLFVSPVSFVDPFRHHHRCCWCSKEQRRQRSNAIMIRSNKYYA